MLLKNIGKQCRLYRSSSWVSQAHINRLHATFCTASVAEATRPHEHAQFNTKYLAKAQLQKNPLNETISDDIFYEENMKLVINVLQSTQLINSKFDSITIDQICNQFVPYKPDKHGVILERIERVIINYQQNASRNSQLNQKQSTSISSKQPDRVSAESILNALLYIDEFFDKGEVGLLRGDIHAHSIYRIQQILNQKSIKLLHKVSTSLSMKELYKQIFDQITSSKNFRLPQNGIRTDAQDSPRNLYERQLILEKESNQDALKQFLSAYESLQKFEKLHNLSTSRKYMAEWFPKLTKAIKDEQAVCRNENNLKGERKHYAESLLKLSPEKLATVSLTELMKEILKQIGMNGRQKGAGERFYGAIVTRSLIENIGTLINAQLVYDRAEKQFKSAQKKLEGERKKKPQTEKDIMDKIDDLQQLLDTELADTKTAPSSQESATSFSKMKYMKPEARKQYLLKMAAAIVKKRNVQRMQLLIPKETQLQIGGIMVYLLKEIIKIKNSYGLSVPLLTAQYKKSSHKFAVIPVLSINQHFISHLIPQLEKQDSPFLHIDRALPTICEPSPWMDYQIGGYYLRPTSMMRFAESQEQQSSLKHADIGRVARVLDGLSAVPWKVNRRVLEVVQKIWQNGGNRGVIPPRHYDMKNYVYMFQVKQQREYERKMEMLKKIQSQRDEHSLRCDFNLKLKVARSFLNVDRFYFPHNIDFRGRAYPIPPHLNHMGADLARGLLTFAQGKKLGPSGLRWLKIHCANLMGKDKAIIPDKLEYIHANLALIKAIAQEPLVNTQWLEYQDCWQALAAITELNEALRQSIPEEYISHLHVHQDGSCNGLQHYAALGRDSEGAAQVNLDALPRPGDVYTHVSKMVSQMVEIDSSNNESPNYELANKIKGNIKRKTVKQTVMTSVYGVTFIGAREQIHRQLKDQAFLNDDDEEYSASIYLARCTMEAIKNLFNGAHNIKQWLIDCAGQISRTNNPVSWITPLGLPVVQPYRSISQSSTVQTLSQSITIFKKEDSNPVNKNKQKSAFPPNFIHSLDSSHMMFTAERCFEKNITFGAVHDSYWTHAATVEDMNKLLREQFVNLHSQPLLQNLKASFERRYPEIRFPDIPERGKFDLNKVKESTYFFS